MTEYTTILRNVAFGAAMIALAGCSAGARRPGPSAANTAARATIHSQQSGAMPGGQRGHGAQRPGGNSRGLRAGSPWPMFRQNPLHTGRGLASGAKGVKKWAFKTGSTMFSAPAIGPDGTIYVGSHDDYLYAINRDGTKKWAFQTSSAVSSSPAIGADGTIYVGSRDSYLYAINPDGTKKWGFKTGNEAFSSPAIGADGMIYVGSKDYHLYAINPGGTRKWAFKTGGGVDSSPAIGADGTIYVGSQDGNLYAIK